MPLTLQHANVQHLPAMLAVLDLGTEAAAARLLACSQSTVSKHLHELDKLHRRPLFSRENRRLTPTPAGELLAVFARRIIAELDDASQALQALPLLPAQGRAPSHR